MATRKLNATAASLLGFLHDGSMTGWDLVVAAQQRIGDFWSLTQSQVYRELNAMAKDGLIKPGKTGPRDRRPYRITRAGRIAFAAWLSESVAEESIRFPLLLVVMFGQHIPRERLAEVVAAHRAIHAERLDRYKKEAAARHDAADPYSSATIDFGLRYEQAVLDWFDSLPPAIQG